VLQCVAARRRVMPQTRVHHVSDTAVCCSVLQCVASVLQCVAVCCSALLRVAESRHRQKCIMCPTRDIVTKGSRPRHKRDTSQTRKRPVTDTIESRLRHEKVMSYSHKVMSYGVATISRLLKIIGLF